MANAIDDIPIAKGNSSNVSDLGFDIITPNRLKLGRNNQRSVHLNGKISDQSLPAALLEKNRKVMTAFYQMLVDRLHHFQVKLTKWSKSDIRQPVVDDIVLFKFNESNSTCDWKIGRVLKVENRKVSIMYSNKSKVDAIPTMRFLERSPRDIVILFSEKELMVNSSEYFGSVISNKDC